MRWNRGRRAWFVGKIRQSHSMIVRPPPPQLTIYSREEYERARRQVAELANVKRGSVEDAVREGLKAAIEAWLRQTAVHKRVPARDDGG